MIRSEIIQSFRDNNPDIPSRVISDVTLQSWLTTGDKEFCAETRCIRDAGTVISTTEDDQSYLLTDEISKFYDINDYPASGVLYNDIALKKTTMARLDDENEDWRGWPSGTPEEWYREGAYLYLDRKIDSNVDDIKIYSILISDDWDSDVAPFNALTYLEPYHYSMVLYLTKRAKAKIAKPEESMKAQAEYSAYVKWVKSQLGGNKNAPIIYRPKSGMYNS